MIFFFRLFSRGQAGEHQIQRFGALDKRLLADGGGDNSLKDHFPRGGNLIAGNNGDILPACGKYSPAAAIDASRGEIEAVDFRMLL